MCLHGEAILRVQLCITSFVALQGTRAQAHVEQWTWDKVAGQYAALIRGNTFTPLSADPFAETAAIAATGKWNGSRIALPSGESWDFLFLTPLHTISMGAYAIYIDNDIQVSLSS